MKASLGIGLVVLGLASILAPSPPAAEPALGRLRAETRSPERRPIVGASVVAYSALADGTRALVVTTTDRFGRAAVDDVPPGRYTVVAIGSGRLEKRVLGLDVGGPYRSVADLVLDPEPAGASRAPARDTLPLDEGTAPAAITLAAVDEGGKPLSGVRVTLEPRGHRADPRDGRTDAQGRLQLGAIEAGAWRLVISRAGARRADLPPIKVGGVPVAIRARLLSAAEGPPLLEDLVPAPALIETLPAPAGE